MIGFKPLNSYCSKKKPKCVHSAKPHSGPILGRFFHTITGYTKRNVPSVESIRGDTAVLHPEVDEMTAADESEQGITVSSDRAQLLDWDIGIQSRYLFAAYCFTLLGVLSGAGAVLQPSMRSIFVVFAGVGLFSAILSVTVSRERFVPASVAEAIHDPLTENQESIAAILGLTGTPKYVPTDDGDVTLYIPKADFSEKYATQRNTDQVLAEDQLSLSLTPVGKRLLERANLPDDELPPQAHEIVELLADVACSQFEIADSVTRLNNTSRSVTLRVDGNVIGEPTQIDNPTVSLFATGLAIGLDQPIKIVDGTKKSTETFNVKFGWHAPTSQTVIDKHVSEAD